MNLGVTRPGLILITAAFLAVGLPAAREARAADVFDPLKKPATPTIRATSSILLATVKAGRRIIAAGERGIIIFSDDSGKTWTQAKVPVSVSITNLSFPTENLGWAVGHSGVILNSVDGGKTWQIQMSGKEAADIELKAAKSAGQNSRRLSDAARLVSDGPDKPLLDVRFWSPVDGMVIGAYGLAFTTSDGGRTWNSIVGNINNPKGKHLYNLFIDQQTILIAGEQGALYRGSLRDLNFEELHSPYGGTYFGVLKTPKNTLIAFGLRGNVYRSENAGKDWEKIGLDNPVTLTAGLIQEGTQLVLSDAAGRVHSSVDDGKTFQTHFSPDSTSINGLSSLENGKILIAGVSGIHVFNEQKNALGVRK